jgi:hypothetical protein
MGFMRLINFAVDTPGTIFFSKYALLIGNTMFFIKNHETKEFANKYCTCYYLLNEAMYETN